MSSFFDIGDDAFANKNGIPIHYVFNVNSTKLKDSRSVINVRIPKGSCLIDIDPYLPQVRAEGEYI